MRENENSLPPAEEIIKMLDEQVTRYNKVREEGITKDVSTYSGLILQKLIQDDTGPVEEISRTVFENFEKIKKAVMGNTPIGTTFDETPLGVHRRTIYERVSLESVSQSAKGWVEVARNNDDLMLPPNSFSGRRASEYLKRSERIAEVMAAALELKNTVSNNGFE